MRHSSIVATGEDPLHMLAQANTPTTGKIRTISGAASMPPPPAYIYPSPAASMQAAPKGNDDVDFQARAFLDSGGAPPPLDLQDVQIGEKAQQLRALVAHGAWGEVAGLSEGAATAPDMLLEGAEEEGAESGPVLSALLAARLQALLRLRMFDALQEELPPVLQALQRAISVQGGQRDVWGCVTFVRLRVLQAEVNALTGRGELALEELLRIHSQLARQAGQAAAGKAQRLQRWRVRSATVNVAIKQRLFKLASSQLFALLAEVRQLAGREKQTGAAEEAQGLRWAEVVLLCRLARLFLHQGALQLGISHCDEAMEVVTAARLDEDPVAQHVQLTRGLALFSISDYGEASKIFEELLLKQADAGAGAGAVSCYAGAVFPEDVHSSCVNSFAVCALHLKRMGSSIQRLEALVLQNPARHLTDPIVFNLCTLYDLSCSAQASLARKHVLQRVAALYHVTGAINPKSYRL